MQQTYTRQEIMFIAILAALFGIVSVLLLGNLGLNKHFENVPAAIQQDAIEGLKMAMRYDLCQRHELMAFLAEHPIHVREEEFHMFPGSTMLRADQVILTLRDVEEYDTALIKHEMQHVCLMAAGVDGSDYGAEHHRIMKEHGLCFGYCGDILPGTVEDHIFEVRITSE